MAQALRTVFIVADPLPSAAQLRWPDKDPGDTAFYTADATRYMPEGDSILPGFTMTPLPAGGATPLLATVVASSATSITWQITGGNVASPITDYQCQLNFTTASGLVCNRTIWMRVRPLSVNMGYNGAGSAVQIVLQGGSSQGVVQYGADPSGANDSTPAFEQAFANLPAEGGEIVVPQGDYKLASALVFSGKPVSIRGAGKGVTRIHVYHSGIAFDIAPGTPVNRVQLVDFSAFAECTTGPVAAVARVTYPAESSFGYVTTIVSSVECFGYPNPANGLAPFPQTFTRGLILNGCWSSQIDNLSWFGPPSAAGATNACAIELNGSNDTRITAAQAYYGAALVIQTGYCQGIYMLAPVVVGCDYVLMQTAQSGWANYVPNSTSLLGLWIHAGELNTKLGTLLLDSVTLGSLSGCDISRDTGPSTAQTLLDFTDVSEFAVTACNFNGGPGGLDIAINFQAAYNSSANIIAASRCANLATALNITGANGTVGLMVNDLDAGGAAILDGSAITAGNRIYSRGHASASNPSGIVSPRDFVWQGPDYSVLMRLQSLQGATDYLKIVAAAPGGASAVTLQTQVGALILQPATQLWLGAQSGAGAVYSATIAGVTANPGNAQKIWNAGGVLAFGGALNPAPVFDASFTAKQPWADKAANAAIFSHNAGIVPPPPAPLAGLSIADKFKMAGVYNFGEIWNPAQNNDAWPTLQNFLLYAQLMYRAQKGGAFDNVALRSYVDVYLPCGDYLVAQPLIVPENVRLTGPGRICRAAYTGNQSNDGTDSVPGPFATNQFLPTVVVAPHGHLGDLNIYVNTDGVFAHRGSGVCIGRTWAAQIGQPCAVGAPGSGYTVGEIIYAAQPSPSAFWAWEAQVTAVDGNGGITAAVVYNTGAYALPPAALMYNAAPGLQETQWTAANGFSCFDPAHAGCFWMNGGATAASLAPAWMADYQAGATRYTIGAAISAGITVGKVQITGAVPSTYAAGYGPTFAVMVTGLEFEIESIQTLGGNAGVYGCYAQDVRIDRLNCVEGAVPIMLQGCGSWHAPLCVFDTCGSIGQIDQSHGIHMRGRVFWEPGNLTINGPLINTQAAPDGKHYALIIGGASSPANPCASLDLDFHVEDMGGLPASTIALYPGSTLGSMPPSQQAATCFAQYLFNSTINLKVTNLSAYGTSVSLLPTSGLYRFGYNVDPSCVFLGSLDTVPTIDGVAPPAAIIGLAFSEAWPGCAVRAWDGLHAAWLGQLGTAEIIGAGAPSNGTSGTGAGFAAPGSAFIDTASGAGRLYTNTNTTASPTWS